MLPERIACFRTSIRIEARPELVAGLAARWTKLKCAGTSRNHDHVLGF